MATYRDSTQTFRAPYNRTLCIYEIQTPDVVVATLERALIQHMKNSRTALPVRFFYGDTDYPKFEEVHKRPCDPGLDWMEENETIGWVGRSTGEKKIPLLIPTLDSSGGGSILDGSIVRLYLGDEE